MVTGKRGNEEDCGFQVFFFSWGMMLGEKGRQEEVKDKRC